MEFAGGDYLDGNPQLLLEFHLQAPKIEQVRIRKCIDKKVDIASLFIGTV